MFLRISNPGAFRMEDIGCNTTVLRTLLFTTVLLLMTDTGAFGGVTVTQNLGPGATAWLDSPIVSTVTNPSAQGVVGESFAGGGASALSETFTVPSGSDYQLQTIFLYAGGGTGTSTTATVTLNLYYLGGRLAPNPNTYSTGFNLLGNGSGLPITYTTQPNGLLRLDFTESDQIVLRGGRMYAFSISGVNGTSPITWFRTASDTYAGGAAYRNSSWINGNSARDFALALYGPVTTAPPTPAESMVNASISHQQIDGFGAGVVFLDAGLSPLTDAQMDALYGTGLGQFGLTLIRVRISPTGDFSDALPNALKAHQRGAKVLATPWTPPAAMKDNNNLVNGGSLLPSAYGDYVAHLNGFIETMEANGSPVSVISLQNEADFTATYESGTWSPAQFQIFCRDFAGGIKAPVMMPESFHFDQALSNPTLNDPAAAANVGYIGGHLYGTGVTDYPLAHALGKHTWMTEFLINNQTIASALDTATQISDTLTVGNMSAYIWWKTIGNANGLLDASGVPQRRGFVMGQFSRFVRPGDFRIDVSGNTGPLSVSAFKDPVTGRFAIVVVNNTTLTENQKFDLSALTTANVTPWVTSATQSLEQQPPVTIVGGTFTFDVPAQSVVTFAGTDMPAITSAARVTTTFGQPFTYMITATNSPTSYGVQGLPPGLQLDPVTGTISGTPTASGDYATTVLATNAGGTSSFNVTITVQKATAAVTLGNLTAFYDGTPRVASIATVPSGLSVIVTYNDQSAPPLYPGTYTVNATTDDPNYVGGTTGTLQVDITGLVRHATSLNGSIAGSVQLLTSENTTLNGNAAITGDLLVPGTPQVRMNGHPTFQGTIDGPGPLDPSTATITLNGQSALRNLVRRMDPLTLPVVAAPPQPQGTRSVSLNSPNDTVDDFTTVANLTLNSNAGMVAVPPGTYGSFSVNGGSGLVLGSPSGPQPAVYNLQNLTLNGGSQIQITGRVVLVLNRGLSVNSGVTFSDHPADWFVLEFASGGLALNGDDVLSARVVAPNGTVTLSGNSTLLGTVKADRLIVNANAKLMTQ